MKLAIIILTSLLLLIRIIVRILYAIIEADPLESMKLLLDSSRIGAIAGGLVLISWFVFLADVILVIILII